MKICLVNANINPGLKDFLRAEVQLGLLYLAAALEQKGRNVEIIDVNLATIYEGWPLDDGLYHRAAEKIAETGPDLIGINTRCDSFPASVNIAKSVRELLPGVPILMGGFHVTFLAKETLDAFPFVDFVLRGEAEYSINHLVDALEKGDDLENVRGLTFRKNGVVIENPDAELPMNLDLLPMPAYSRFESYLKTLSRFEYPEMYINAGRGCPFHCKFCVCHKIYRGEYRLRSAESIIEEIEFLKNRYGIAGFNLGVDHFLIDKGYVENFCRLLIGKKLDIFWSCNGRPENLDERLLSLMRESGLRSIFFGIETGSPRLQKKIRKNIDLEGVLPLIALCEKFDLITYLGFVLGFPDETEDEFNMTLRMALDCSSFYRIFLDFHIFSPMAGSAIYDEIKDGLVWTGLIGDIAEAGSPFIESNIELIRRYPRLFSVFYSPPLEELSPVTVHESVNLYKNILPHYHLAVKIALDELDCEPLELFSFFRSWAKDKGLFKSGAFLPTHYDLVEIFPAFLRGIYKKKNIPAAFMELVLKGESAEAKKKMACAEKFVHEAGAQDSPYLNRHIFGRNIPGTGQ
ncbi:MAG: B12-binding domain-containing radical SAM protein [Chloroflexi bacterium]|nr:B12-binding domain-containing radical SAM protein [Chloroflexota bacterium]